ncbi:MAG: M48 family metallopeptidase [Hyphomonadaceae bacterium]|nr:M48 family metallopeptidase [Hyphomonadaceae bacterium]
MRILAFAIAILGLSAVPAGALPFDPDAATRAWLDTMGADATARSNAYFEGGYWIDLAGTLVSVAVAALILLLGWARGVRAWLERTVKWFPFVAFGVSFFVNLVSTVLTFPFSYYVGFVREHRYDLSTQTFPEWFNEQLIGAGIGLIVGSIFLAILYLIIRAAKNTWWVWGSAATVVFAGALIFLQPVYIEPLFNTYTPMQEGELKDDILAMAQANGVPAHDVLVYDRSRQTNSISANVAGLFGTTRIALADTLLERGSPEAVRAVMGHEIGHYVLGHIYSLMIMTAGLIIITFAIVHFAFRAITKGERWGVRDISDPAGLPVILAIISAVGLLATPIQNNITRFHENQADAFGLNLAREPDGFAEAAVMLSEYRKMEPSALEEWVFYTHPSGWNRVHRAMVWKANEIAAGRLPASPGGPPEGWVPDFVRAREAASPEPSPAVASD